jgi:hypothetical protein
MIATFDPGFVYFTITLTVLFSAPSLVCWICRARARYKERRFKQSYDGFVNSCRIYGISAPTEEKYRELMEYVKCAGKK